MRIETKRLVLRPFLEKDLQDVYAYLSQIKVHCFMEEKAYSLEDASKQLKHRIENKDSYWFAIEEKESGKVIGEILMWMEPANESKETTDTFSPCWMINENYQKKGYTYEAAYAVFDTFFRKGLARRIYAYTEEDNYASQGLCKKLGMRQEAFYKEFISFVEDENGNPIYENTLEFAILRREWMESHE